MEFKFYTKNRKVVITYTNPQLPTRDIVVLSASVSIFPINWPPKIQKNYNTLSAICYNNCKFPVKYDYIGKTKKQALQEIAHFLIEDFEAEFNLNIMKD